MRYACNIHSNRSLGRQILHSLYKNLQQCHHNHSWDLHYHIGRNIWMFNKFQVIWTDCITVLVGIFGCSTNFKWFGQIWQLLMNSLGILNRVMSEESRVCHHKETSQFYVERKEKMAIKMSIIQVSFLCTTLRPWEREEIFREGPLCKRKSSFGVGGYM